MIAAAASGEGRAAECVSKPGRKRAGHGRQVSSKTGFARHCPRPWQGARASLRKRGHDAAPISGGKAARPTQVPPDSCQAPLSRGPARSATTPITADAIPTIRRNAVRAFRCALAIARLATPGNAANSNPSSASTSPSATRKSVIPRTIVTRRLAAAVWRTRAAAPAVAAARRAACRSDRRNSGRNPNPASAACACRCGAGRLRRPASTGRTRRSRGRG